MHHGAFPSWLDAKGVRITAAKAFVVVGTVAFGT
jgi:hypothetical protein